MSYMPAGVFRRSKLVSFLEPVAAAFSGGSSTSAPAARSAAGDVVAGVGCK